MSTATQIERLTTARNTIRTKLVELGLSESTDLLDALAEDISNIANNGAVSQTLDATTGKQSYTVPAGYHNGSGSVSITLEQKSATPTKSEQTVTPTSGKVLSSVTVAAIPDEYQDVSNVTATAGDVLAGKVFVDATGAEIEGAIPEKDSDDLSFSGSTVTAPAGYYATAATKTLAAGTLAAEATGEATVESVSFNYDSENEEFAITGSGTISGTATASVATAGFVASDVTASGSTTGTASVDASVAMIKGSTAISGTKTFKPAIARTETAAVGAKNVGSGSASTSAPSSGYFVSVQSPENTGTVTATPSVTAAGYGTTAHNGLSGASETVGAEQSDVTYIGVAAGSAATPATTITGTPNISVGSDGLISVSVSGSQSITPTVTEGYVESGTAGTVTVSGSGTEQLPVLAATTYNTSDSDQTIPAGKYLTGAQTIKAVTTDGISAANIKSGATVKDENDDDRITSVTGTFTSAATVSQGQTAATAGVIREGYSAWVDGAEVQGSLEDTEVVEGTTSVSGSTATRGEAEWDAGYIDAGSISAATFANTASAGVEYVDISATTDAPVLVSDSYLFINKGYTDNLKISLAKLVPDGASADLASDMILSGYSAYDNDGKLVAGSIQSLAATTYDVSSSDQVIAAGKYLAGAQTIRGVQVSGISAANIKTGETVKVGDSADDDRITSVTGTFTSAATVSAGQTAAAAGQMLTGYSAWVDGAEVQGSMANNGAVSATINGLTVTSYTVPAGFHNGSGTVSLTNDIENALAAI